MKNTSLILSLIFAGTLLFPSCKVTSQTAKFDLAKAKKEIAAANKIFTSSIKKGDAAAVAECYTKGSKMMPPNAPAIEGRADIFEYYQSMFVEFEVALELTTIEVFAQGNMIVEEGQAVVKMQGAILDNEKYLTLWKKEGGKWKIHRDIYNSNNQIEKFDAASAKKEIAAANEIFTSNISKGDAAAVAECYTDDGKFMIPNAPHFVLSDRIFVRHKNQLVKVFLEDILFAEADRNYCRVHTKEKEYLLTLPLREFEENLPPENFMRTHRFYLVNLPKIEALIDNQETIVFGDKTVPVSRRFKEAVIKRLPVI